MQHKIHKRSLIPSEVFLPIIEAAEYWKYPCIKAMDVRCMWTSGEGEIEQSTCTYNGVYFEIGIAFNENTTDLSIYEAIIHELHHAYDFKKFGQSDEAKVIQTLGLILENLRATDYQAIQLLEKWREQNDL